MEMYTYDLLSNKEATLIADKIRAMDWQEGATLNPDMAGKVKNNRELGFSECKPHLSSIYKKLASHKQFNKDTYCYKIFPPKFNSYSDGGEYKRHSDAPFMDIRTAKSVESMRTDYSMTLFLTDGYEGGELVVEDEVRVKGPVGSCIVYPSDSMHYVTPVTKGERICAITWIQSRIRSKEKRVILRELSKSLSEMEEFSKTQTTLGGVHGKLVRMWSD